MTRLKTIPRARVAALAATAALGVALSACGGNDETATTSSSASSPGGKQATVSLKSIDGVGDVLVNSSGQALYFSDQEAGGKIMCKADCLTFWQPLKASGAKPTAGPDVSGKLAQVKRPDGTMQVTFDGKPLYRFTEDSAPGQVTGNNFKDDFDGTQFTWHAVTTSGSSAGGGAKNSDDSSRGGGYTY
jgi:predicted lipoprotein with Yx(FWY)xxD motif